MYETKTEIKIRWHHKNYLSAAKECKKINQMRNVGIQNGLPISAPLKKGKLET